MLTTAEIVRQIQRAIDEAQTAEIFAADLHPEVADLVRARINAARAILQAEEARLHEMAKELAG